LLEPLLLILDLDETLIYASETPLDRPVDFHAAEYSVYKRPHLDVFLAQVFERYRVAIWTASGRGYAEVVLPIIMPSRAKPEFIWCAERCTTHLDRETGLMYPLKDLNKVRKRGYNLERILAVDDTPRKYKRSYGNLITVLRFEGDPKDNELVLLLKYLQHIENQPNFRRIEKRDWRSRLSIA